MVTWGGSHGDLGGSRGDWGAGPALLHLQRPQADTGRGEESHTSSEQRRGLGTISLNLHCGLRIKQPFHANSFLLSPIEAQFRALIQPLIGLKNILVFKD